MFSNNVIGIFSQIPILLYTKVASYTINYDAHTVLFINSETLVTNSPNNSAILDSSNNNFTITNTGSVLQGSVSPFDPFEKSAYFNGSNTYLSAASNSAFGFGTGDFTIECWIYRLKQGGHGASNFDCIIDFRNNIVNSPSAGVLYSHSDSTIRWYLSGADRITGSVVPNNKWTHLAISRSSSSTRLFIDGVQSGSTHTDTTNYTNSPVNIGRFYNGTATITNGIFEGYMSDVRVTKGQALYTATFTPPTSALSLTANGGAAINAVDPLSSNVSLLTLQKDSLFTDKSTNNFSLTSTNVGSYPLYPFASSSITYSSSAHGGSLYFNGNTSYLSIPANSATALSSFDFTIEFWAYLTNANANAVQTFYSNYTSFSDIGSLFFGKHNNSSGKVQVFIRNFSNTNPFMTEPTLPPSNQWVHYALVRSGSTFSIYRNGTQTATAGLTGSVTNATNPNYIGTDGAVPANDIQGYLSDFRITKGQALYTSNFTPPTASLSLTANGGATPSVAPTSSNVSLLLKGTNAEILDAVCKNNISVGGSTRVELNTPTDQIIADQSTNNFSLTTTNNIDVDTNSVYAPSGYSGYFNGSNYLSVNLTTAINTDNFTLEYWHYSTNGGNMGVIGLGESWSSSSGISFLQFSTFYRITVGGVEMIGTNLHSISTNQWIHWAITKTGTTAKVYRNGTEIGSQTSSNSLSSNKLLIGIFNPSNSWTAGKGYLSDFRITKGQALYTSNFTPPTASLSLTANGGATPSVAPLSSNVSLLTLQLQDKTIKDNSNNNLTLTSTNAGLLLFNPFYAYPQSNILTYGGSLYFNGNASLTIADNTAFNLSSQNFTIEFWIYPMASTGWVLGKGNASTAAGSMISFPLNTNWSFYSSTNTYTVTKPSLPLNTWTHVAIVRNGTTITAFGNGVSSGSANAGVNVINTGGTNPLSIGKYSTTGMTGYLSDFRITKGQALYTSNFTPPTASLSLTANGDATPSEAPSASNVSLLLNNFIPSLTSNNRSIKFPQNGFLQVPNVNDLLTLGSGDYTIEFNLFNPIRGVQQTIIDQRIDATTQARLLVTINASNKLVVDINGTIITSTNEIPYKKWTKYSIFKTSGALGLAVNDVVDADTVAAEPTTYLAPTNGTRIGTDFASLSALSGYIDDFKVIKGVSKFQGYSSTTVRARTFDYLVVAGGGGAGAFASAGINTAKGSGAGAGGVLYNTNTYVTNNYIYTIVVGSGGAGENNDTVYGDNGGNSSLQLPSSTITCFGGGGGAGENNNNYNGRDGGSGGGGKVGGGGTATGGAGTAGQGNKGGDANGGYPGTGPSGGGGGAGAASTGINGGVGYQWLDNNFYGGGGGGIAKNNTAGLGGSGGGANGQPNTTDNGFPGEANTGGGAGGVQGQRLTRTRQNGGSGVVILRTAENSRVATTTGSPVITVSGGYRYYKFTGTGTFKP
jgi:hypothetical protein